MRDLLITLLAAGGLYKRECCGSLDRVLMKNVLIGRKERCSMYQRIVQLPIVLVVALVVSGFGLKGFTSAAQASEPTKANTAQGNMTAEGTSSQPANLPNERFQKARESFLKKDLKASGDEIRKIATFLRHQAANATEEGKKGLTASANELGKLANGVEKGTVTSVKTLDNAFDKARQALSRRDETAGQNSQAEKQPKGIGHTLKGAASAVGNGLVWSGEKVKSGTVWLAQGTVDLGGKLIKGTGELAKGAVKTVGDAGGYILRLGRKPQSETS